MTARRIHGVQSERTTDEMLVVVPETFEAHALNPSAAAVYERCTGDETKAAMAAEIHRRTGLPADEAIVDLALAELRDAGLVVLDDATTVPAPTRRGLVRALHLSATAARHLPVVETILIPPIKSDAQTGDAAARAADPEHAPARRRPDVSFKPATDESIDEMLALAGVDAGDLVYDLGCGDGRIVIAAARTRGCRAIGVDLDPRCVAMARARVVQNDVAERVRIEEGDVFEVDLRDADVVLLYLLPELNVRLIPQLLTLKPGARVVSQDFDMQGVIPDRVVQTYSAERHLYKTFFLWTAPLKRTDRPVPREWAQSRGTG